MNGSEQRTVQITQFLESLINQIPYSSYVSNDQNDEDENCLKFFLASSAVFSKKAIKTIKVKQLRYHPFHWFSTSYALRRVLLKHKHYQHRPLNKKESALACSDSSLLPLSRSNILQIAREKAAQLKSITPNRTKNVMASKRSSLHTNSSAKNNSSSASNQFNTFLLKPLNRKTKRQKLSEALRDATRKEELLSQMHVNQKMEIEEEENRQIALQRAAGNKVYTDIKRLKKALKSRNKKSRKKKF